MKDPKDCLRKITDKDRYVYYDEYCYDGDPGSIYDAMEEYAKEILEDYTQFLLNHGYVDTDVWAELPSAIDRFMHQKLNK